LQEGQGEKTAFVMGFYRYLQEKKTKLMLLVVYIKISGLHHFLRSTCISLQAFTGKNLRCKTCMLF
jgi:hypothetical protein